MRVGNLNGVGVCTFQVDTDDDGIGDLCDGCPQDPDAPRMTVETNCNLIQEVATNAKYPYKTDQCDPAPCASFVFGWDDRLPNPTDPKSVQWNVGGYTPRILPKPHASALPYTTARPTAKVGFRYCECDLGDEVECARNSVCPVNQAMGDYAQSAKWNQVATAKLDLNPVPPMSANDPPWAWPGTPVPGAEISGNATFSGNSNANVQDPGLPYAGPGELNYLVAWDVGSLPLKDLPPPSGLGAPGHGLNVVMWSHVPRVEGINVVLEPVYRPTANSHVLGVLGSPPIDYPQPGDFPLDRCGPLCDFRDCKVCEYERFDPSIWINPVDNRILAGDNGRLAEISDAFSQGLRTSLLNGGDSQWVLAEEPRQFRRDDTVLAAVLTPPADQVVAFVQRVGDTFVDPRTIIEPGPGIAADGVGVSSPASLEAVNGAELVLSANERAVFSVGGMLGEGEEARPAGVRRLSTLSHAPSWTPLGFDVIFGQMLAASYSPVERSLYALDLAEGRARLWRLELASEHATELGSWRLGAVDQAFLSATWNGEMLLATTGSGTYRIAGFRVENDHIVASWEAQGAGTLVAQPTLKQEGLDVITINGNGLRESLRLLPPSPNAMAKVGRCLE